MSGYTDLWVQPENLHEGLMSLVWAASEGFADLVLVCDEKRFAQYGEAILALDLGLSIHWGVALDLSSRVPGPGQIWGGSSVFVQLPPGRCDLKRVARVLGEIVRSGFAPVVVGAERSAEIQRQPELLRYLLAAGAVLCGLAGGITGKYGNGCRVTARRIASLGYYHLFAGYVQKQVPVREVIRHLEDVRPGWRRTQSDSHLALQMRPQLLLREGADYEGN